MTGSFTGRAVAEMVQKYAGSHPVDVEVVNDHDGDRYHPIGASSFCGGSC